MLFIEFLSETKLCYFQNYTHAYANLMQIQL